MTREQRDENRALADRYDALDAVLTKIAHFVTPFDGQPDRPRVQLLLRTYLAVDAVPPTYGDLHIEGLGCPVAFRYANLLRNEIIQAAMNVQGIASGEIRSLGETTAADAGASAG
jgi:hypothetical protein